MRPQYTLGISVDEERPASSDSGTSSVIYVMMTLGSGTLPPTVVNTGPSISPLVGLAEVTMVPMGSLVSVCNDWERCNRLRSIVPVALPGTVCVSVIVTVFLVSVTVFVVGMSSVLVTFFVWKSHEHV